MMKSRASTTSKQELVPTIGFISLVIFGVGDMLGAGIYSLVGVTAGALGNFMWAGFLVSLFAAILTGLSYANLGSRYPKAAGAAYITKRAFNVSAIAYVVGLVVLASGITSMAAAAHAFALYLAGIFPDVPLVLASIAFLCILASIAVRGMKESAAFNALCTTIELGGLLFIIAIGLPYWGDVSLLDATSLKNPSGEITPQVILQGAVLTFFAFIGFEDMLNVSEEVKNPSYVFPRAVVVALVITSMVYIAISITAVSVVPHAELAVQQSTVTSEHGPLVKVVEVAAPWLHPQIFAIISLFAIANTALLNFLMASRLSYGMARQGLLPTAFGMLHGTRRTPHVAIVITLGVGALLVLVGDLAQLASATSLLLLLVFVVINIALIRLKLTEAATENTFEVPLAVPFAACVICLAMITAKMASGEWRSILIAAAVVGTATVLYFLTRSSHRADEIT